jgi:hypothetical protein
MTAEELLRLPDDGYRYELVRGELRNMGPAGYLHGRVAINVTTPLDRHVRVHELGQLPAGSWGNRLQVR